MTRRSLSRRTLLALAGGCLATGALAACQAPAAQSVPSAPQPASQPAPSPQPKPSGPTLILATSELVVGPNRFAIGIVDEANQPILDAKVTFGFFQVDGAQATKRAEAPATFRWVEQRAKGIYTAPVTFDAPGKWGVEADIQRDGKRQVVRAPFEVKAQGSAPMIGSPAIRSKTLTTKDVGDPSTICTAAPPCELHTISLDDALGNGKPTAVLFASPGFCTSQTCAPQLGVLLQVKPKHADALNFVHVEIYKDPRNGVLADAVTEWNLPSEPWIFFVDRAGTIVERFDGIATAEEIEGGIARIAT
jgi:hypothetical protein